MNRFWLTLVVLLAAALGMTTCALHRARGQRDTYAMQRDSVEAKADTTRQLGGKVQRALGDSLAAVQHRAVQAEAKRDSLDRALDLARVANVELRTSIVSLKAQLQAPVTETALGERTASWTLRQPPYTVDATAILPAPPASGTLRVSVRLDTAHLTVRLGCGAPRNGVRPAEVTVVGPTWLRTTINTAQQSPELCNQDKSKAGAWSVMVGGGYTMSPKNAGWGGFVGAGYAWRWP
jgi:hypothetical protein